LDECYLSPPGGDQKMKNLLSAAIVVFSSLNAFAGPGVGEIAKWTALAARTYKSQPKSSQVTAAKVVLAAEGATVVFILPDGSKVEFMCHSMDGQDMCM